jgi:hypothetical protein
MHERFAVASFPSPERLRRIKAQALRSRRRPSAPATITVPRDVQSALTRTRLASALDEIGGDGMAVRLDDVTRVDGTLGIAAGLRGIGIHIAEINDVREAFRNARQGAAADGF